jgi:hypothetical protein
MPRFSSKARAYLWSREKTAAYRAGRGLLPICNICDLPVLECDAWDESHDPGRAAACGGRSVGIAHRLCNRRHGAQVVVPMLAKADRAGARHIGAAGPGLGRHPMRAGRRSGLSKTMRHGVQPRLTNAQKHARMIERLRVAPSEVSP